jgi:hypothetical protein
MDFDQLVSLATLVLAGVAASVSWLNFRKSGTQKLAQYRKEWIEDLRKHLSEFIAICFERISKRPNREAQGFDPDGADPRENNNSDWSRLVFLLAYLQLMLNKKEDLHQRLEKQLFTLANADVTSSNLNELTETAKAVLKSEWDRLKTEL